MLRRFSVYTLRRLAPALLALALAPQTACSSLPHWMPWSHDAASSSDDARDDGMRERGQLQSDRDQMREARDRAWADVAKDGRAHHYGPRNAVALSKATRRIDDQSGWERAPVPGRATLGDLPRRDWWYLFTPPSEWSAGPLAIDRERLPGYYAAMIDALEHVIATAKPGAPALTAEGYLELHRIATAGVFDRDRDAPIAPGFARERVHHLVAALHEVGAVRQDHLALALAELKDEGLAGWSSEIQREHGSAAPPAWLATILGAHEDVNPHTKPVALIYRREHRDHGIDESLVAVGPYENHAAHSWAAQWLADYAAEAQKAPHRTPAEYLDQLGGGSASAELAAEPRLAPRASDDLIAAVRPIARLIRRLQVSHLFCDSAEPVDTVLLLDALLAASGLPPSILEDAAMFGGREPLDELAWAIVKGQRRYQMLVRELVARDMPPVAPAQTAQTAPPALQAAQVALRPAP